ncbi:MAG: shikimate dehydrogenase [Actinomycetota bacterium]|nr:shikimate dehydrogenase [Actinomycetota bacterium]
MLGKPVTHSLSPVLHRAAYAELGLDWTYEAVEMDAAGLPAFLGGLDEAWRGLSLTMPLKRVVVPLVDSLDDWARRSGVVNTVVFDEDGSRNGHNTDVPGAVAAIRSHCSGPLRTAVVLGGGATAASMLLALAELGCTTATLRVRDPGRAARTVTATAEHRRELAVEVGPLTEGGEWPSRADILISTLPVSAWSTQLLATWSGIPVVFDVGYQPWPTPLLRASAEQGRALVTGLDLLVQQAALQVSLMTGTPDPPVAAIQQAGARALVAG